MKYLLFALKLEAQAFVDKFKLGKSKSNDEIAIIITGIGKENMFNSTKKLISKIKSEDSIVNIGICGASKSFKIGELIEIGIPMRSMGTSGDDRGFLTCVDEAIDETDTYDAVDMESDGFIEASKGFENRYMFKIVSDHFEPHKVTKDGAKRLIYEKIDEIMTKVSI